ncbi:MAG TPA: hypothetical protein VG962_16030 [Steroidobacteraceae bacterium]|nr:hypothetical protein [Steroidobacteraceae bacterium]
MAITTLIDNDQVSAGQYKGTQGYFSYLPWKSSLMLANKSLLPVVPMYYAVTSQQNKVDSMEPEILKAMSKPEASKRIALYVMIGMIVVLLGKTVLFPSIKLYLSVHDKTEAFSRFKTVMYWMSAALLPVVIYLSSIAVRIIKARQFPYPGAKVFRDTEIVRGKHAIIKGVFVALAAVWVLGCAIYAAVLPRMMAHHFESETAPADQQVASPAADASR